MTPVVTAGKSPTKTTRPCVLVVDDEPEVLKLFSDIVGKQNNCTILRAPDLKQAKLLMDKHPVHLLVADISLPDGDGLELLPRLQEKHPTATAMIITGRPDVHNSISAIRAGAVDFREQAVGHFGGEVQVFGGEFVGPLDPEFIGAGCFLEADGSAGEAGFAFALDEARAEDGGGRDALRVSADDGGRAGAVEDLEFEAVVAEAEFEIALCGELEFVAAA